MALRHAIGFLFPSALLLDGLLILRERGRRALATAFAIPALDLTAIT